MVHFIRDGRETIIECQTKFTTPSQQDLSAAINVFNYSAFLLKENSRAVQLGIVQDFEQLNEIRGWWWEQAEDSGEYNNVDAFVAEKFKEIATKYKLYYVTD